MKASPWNHLIADGYTLYLPKLKTLRDTKNLVWMTPGTEAAAQMHRWENGALWIEHCQHFILTVANFARQLGNVPAGCYLAPYHPWTRDFKLLSTTDWFPKRPTISRTTVCQLAENSSRLPTPYLLFKVMKSMCMACGLHIHSAMIQSNSYCAWGNGFALSVNDIKMLLVMLRFRAPYEAQISPRNLLNTAALISAPKERWVPVQEQLQCQSGIASDCECTETLMLSSLRNITLCTETITAPMNTSLLGWKVT